jgi:hypothetical protein
MHTSLRKKILSHGVNNLSTSQIIRGVDGTDTDFAQNTYYDMSYHLGCTEEDAEVKKVVDKAQGYFNA